MDVERPDEGRLRVVATPIGHLDDLSPRAAEALVSADLVLCEDTRVTARLLARVVAAGQRRPPCWSLNAHNEADKTAEVVARIAAGDQVVLVSDAGTPCLSDPGQLLVEAVHVAGLRVETVPGPFAAAAALAASGLAPIPFAFWGFLEKKTVGRRRQLAAALTAAPAGGAMTHAFYVPGRDLRVVLADVAVVVPEARVVVGRELTKIHESWLRGTAAVAAAALLTEQECGEAVLLVEVNAATAALADSAPPDLDALVTEALLARRDRKQAMREIARRCGVGRREVYAAWDRLQAADDRPQAAGSSAETPDSGRPDSGRPDSGRPDPDRPASS